MRWAKVLQNANYALQGNILKVPDLLHAKVVVLEAT